jgi:simple sugar transport system ATP-binding protein
MMVGADTPSTPRDAMTPGAPILELQSLTVEGDNARNSLHSVDLTVHAHEVVGIAGVSGNGQSMLAKVVSGLTTPDQGAVKVEGNPVSKFDPLTLLKAGVGRIPEDRHHDGVIGAMSVAENLVIEQLDDPTVKNRGFLRSKDIRANAKKLSEDYDVRGPGIDAEVRLLSGGNIQKLILARVFECSPKLILANQPTRGLDLGAANEVGRRLLEARQRGAGILLISEDLDEVLALSDRIVVIHDGHFVESTGKDRAEIGLMMAGEMT